MPVETPHAEYEAAESKWEKCRDVKRGSDAVKAKGEVYLPKLDIHQKDPRKYDDYVKRAFFYPVMKRTVEGLAGAIFQKSPTIVCPKRMEAIIKDATLGGKPLENLALEVTQQILTVGRAGVLVDMAREGAPETRPYAILYDAEDIVSWRTTRLGGDERLTRVVLRETVETQDEKDPFVMGHEDQYRVCELDKDGNYAQTIWRKKGKNSKKYEIAEELTIERKGKKLDFVPFMFIGPTSISPTVEPPPLEALVDTNLSHYRNSADYEHGLHFTGQPIPWISGMSKSDDGKLEWGSSYALMLEKDGSAGVIQADGEMLGALKDSLDRKEKIMAILGARLLEEQAKAVETATAVGMRHAGEHATLRTVAQTVEMALTIVLQWMAWWSGIEATPEKTDAKVELNKDFFSMRMTSQDLVALVHSLQAEAISFETFYEALVRGELARPGVTAEEEKAAILAGGMSFTRNVEPSEEEEGGDATSAA